MYTDICQSINAWLYLRILRGRQAGNTWDCIILLEILLKMALSLSILAKKRKKSRLISTT